VEKFVKGDVVVVPFTFSDLTQAKRRPALVVSVLEGDDLILSQITSQFIIVNDINKLTFTMCHCERSEAISRDCHVASLLAMTTFQGRSL